MMHSTAIALAGRTAAEIASSAGKSLRGKELTSKELQQLARAGNMAQISLDMLEGRLSYWAFADQRDVFGAMYEWALTHNAIDSDAQTLAVLIPMLTAMATGQQMHHEDLVKVHHTFAKIAREINAFFTSSGERLSA